MNYIKPIEEFLLEGKQVGVVYHYTSIFNLVKILDTNSLKGSILPPQHFQFSEYDLEQGDYEIEKLDNYYSELKNKILSNRCISLTRDKLFHLQSRTPYLDCRLVLDGDMLSNNYEIVPYQYVAHYGKNMEGIGDEQEELLIIKRGNCVTNIRKYIISVDIIDVTGKYSIVNGENGEMFIQYLSDMYKLEELDMIGVGSGYFSTTKRKQKDYILGVLQKNKDLISQKLGVQINFI